MLQKAQNAPICTDVSSEKLDQDKTYDMIQCVQKLHYVLQSTMGDNMIFYKIPPNPSLCNYIDEVKLCLQKLYLVCSP